MLCVLECLEQRRLLDGEPWSFAASLIGQDLLRKNHPEITGAGQTIAILDTGIDYQHPDLGGGFGAGFKVIGGIDLFDNDADPLDSDGHGTQVAGIIGAAPFTLNDRQHAGIAPDANLLAVRISDTPDDPVPDERMLAALQWVLDNRQIFGITIVNISFGFGKFNNRPLEGNYADKLLELKQAGVLVVAASGNNGLLDGQGMQYPAADPSVMAVGSVDEFDTISQFAERDKTLDILAVGEGLSSLTFGQGYTDVTGTSFASPAVAGAAALLWSAAPMLTLADVRSVLRASGRDNVDGDTEFGETTGFHFPRLNVNSAVEIALARTTPSAGASLGQFGNANALAVDADGVLHFVWYDSAQRTMKYAVRRADGNWSGAQIIQNSGDDVGQYLSLAIDSNGKPAVAYFDATQGDLKFAQLNAGIWSHETIDSAQSVGLYASLQFDRENAPIIAYFQKTKGHLRWARIRNGMWEIRDLDTNDVSGRSVSLAMRPDGLFSAAYANSTTGRLKYARQENITGWITETVDQTKGVHFISLIFDQDGRANISYYDTTPANLKFAVQKDNRWARNTVASKGAVGIDSRVLLDNTGHANILFYNRQLNRLQRARGQLGAWTITDLQTTGGRFVAGKFVQNASILCYTWYDADTQTIQLSEAV